MPHHVNEQGRLCTCVTAYPALSTGMYLAQGARNLADVIIQEWRREATLCGGNFVSTT